MLDYQRCPIIEPKIDKINAPISGIYGIFNIVTKKWYCGSSNNVKRRLFTHRKDLRKNCHGNQHLQNSWNLHKEKAFIFVLIEHCAVHDLLTMEQRYLDRYFPNNELYNIDSHSRTFDLNTRAKIGLKSKAAVRTPEWKEKIRNSLVGHGVSLQTRRKISEANQRRRGKKLSTTHVLNLRLSWERKRLQKYVSHEHRD